MGNIAIVFSGQGDQYPGMGKELHEKYGIVMELFTEFEKIRPGTVNQCFYGTEEELRSTSVTQPCLYAFEAAAARVLLSSGIRPSALAGFSSGEITAAAFSGMFDIDTGFRLSIKRGELMETEALKNDTFMAAVLRLTEEKVREICSSFDDVYPVNFNCPGQISVSGLRSSMDAFLSCVKAEGGRSIPINVRGAFHSPFMEEASKAFRKELERTSFSKIKIPLYSDLTGRIYDRDPIELLSDQISGPVLWERIIRNMIDNGIDTFIEAGPGKTLTNMIKRTDPGVRAFTFSEYLEGN